MFTPSGSDNIWLGQGAGSARLGPFGAASAVHSFNRAGEALEQILCKAFGIPCTRYFDDFTLIAPQCMMGAIVKITREVLSLLGWCVKEGEKDLDPAPRFRALGVMYNLV